MQTETITPTLTPPPISKTYINPDVSIVNTVYETRNHNIFGRREYVEVGGSSDNT